MCKKWLCNLLNGTIKQLHKSTTFQQYCIFIIASNVMELLKIILFAPYLWLFLSPKWFFARPFCNCTYENNHIMYCSGTPINYQRLHTKHLASSCWLFCWEGLRNTQKKGIHWIVFPVLRWEINGRSWIFCGFAG